jgi:putative peptide zinc metalloprotease protein
MKIIASKKLLITGASILLLCLALCVPWQKTISAPAVLRPSVQTELYAQSAGKIDHIYVVENDMIHEGQLIATLSSDVLAHQKTKSLLRIKLLTAQLARRVADAQDLNASDVLLRNLNKENATLKGIEELQMALEVRAPHAGRIIELNTDFHIGRYINSSFTIALLVNMEDMEILSFVTDSQVRRIQEGGDVRFLPDDIFAPTGKGRSRVNAKLSFIAPTGEEFLNEDIFSSNFRGPIAVEPTEDGRSRPVQSITRIKAKPKAPLVPVRALRGRIKITAKPQSPGTAIWRRIRQVLIRETDF